MISNRRYQLYAGVLLGVVILAEVINNLKLSGSSVGLIIYWMAAVVIFALFVPRLHCHMPSKYQTMALGYGGAAAAIYLVLMYLTAVAFQALASSPYNHSFSGIVYNLLKIVPVLMGREIIRAFGLNAAWRNVKNCAFNVCIVTIIMIVTEFNYVKMMTLSGAEEICVYIAISICPIITKNILLSTLSWYGGAKSCILYLVIVQGFQRIFPFLPDLPWIAESVIGIAFPILFALFIREYYNSQMKAGLVMKKSHTVVEILFLVAAVSISWFCVGVFPVYPSIILTGSMEPEIEPGDAVMIEKILKEEDIYDLQVGDVINFQRDDYTVTHRIAEILYDEDGNISFRTKGDNNDSADTQIVEPDDIKGIVTGLVPKIGMPVLLLKSGEKVPEGVEDNE